MRLFYITVLYTICIFYNVLIAQTSQFYEAIYYPNSTGNPELRIEDYFSEDPERSFISWGDVFNDKIRLFEIDNTNNGFIEFMIEPTEIVGVYLARESIANPSNENRFGFLFIQGQVFNVIADNEVVPYNVATSGYDNSYTQETVFRVEKCEEVIYYYKDDDVIFSYCEGTGEEIGELYHLLETAEFDELVEKKIDLLFETQLEECGEKSNLVSFINQVSAKKTGNAIHSDQYQEILSHTYPKNSMVVVSLYDEYGRPIRQYRKRTDGRGKMVNQDELKKALSQNPYKVSVKKEN